MKKMFFIFIISNISFAQNTLNFNDLILLRKCDLSTLDGFLQNKGLKKTSKVDGGSTEFTVYKWSDNENLCSFEYKTQKYWDENTKKYIDLEVRNYYTNSQENYDYIIYQMEKQKGFTTNGILKKSFEGFYFLMYRNDDDYPFFSPIIGQKNDAFGKPQFQISL
ncbi:hypothetical protein [Flavobacterium nackdongense]|uniref:Uncharacterized protein n=1 Tax=Flavobacterium nackdongense TaxID=2547394 RepID=A0A4V1AGR6_9FLAO|nr:hypothetical protein [Flavobacterium nackdongense]QBN18972.1 hypothetical protein E1750_09200 [Flavobacterium nackdongense]